MVEQYLNFLPTYKLSALFSKTRFNFTSVHQTSVYLTSNQFTQYSSHIIITTLCL